MSNLTGHFQKNSKKAVVAATAILGASLFLIGEDTRNGLSHKAQKAFETVTAGREGNHQVRAWAQNYKAAAGKAVGAVASKVNKATSTFKM